MSYDFESYEINYNGGTWYCNFNIESCGDHFIASDLEACFIPDGLDIDPPMDKTWEDIPAYVEEEIQWAVDNSSIVGDIIEEASCRELTGWDGLEA